MVLQIWTDMVTLVTVKILREVLDSLLLKPTLFYIEGTMSGNKKSQIINPSAMSEVGGDF